MANLFRLIAACFLCLACLPSQAQNVPPVESWNEASCNAANFPRPGYYGGEGSWSCRATANPSLRACGWQHPQGEFSGQCNQNKVLKCPDNYTATSDGMCAPPPTQCTAGRERDASGQCVCKAGTKEPPGGVGMCIPSTPTDDVCGPLAGNSIGVPFQADYGPTSTGALGRMIGKPSTSCFPGGCAVSGTVSDCYSAGGSASCNLTSVSFTGAKCDDSTKPGSCPEGSSPSEFAAGVCIPEQNNCAAGSTPSKYAAGVCIPDENTCPSGQSPSKYATGVCVPNESDQASGNGETGKPSTCPKGQVPSRYAQGVCIPADTTVGGGGGIVCKDGKCTTTKPDGSTDEKPQDSFCKENPSSPMCKEGKFSGSCSAGFTCEGDAAMCAIAREQHKQNCKLFDETKPDADYSAAANGTDDKSAEALKSSATQVSVSQLDDSGLGWGRACPADVSFDVVGKSFAIPFSKVCPILNVMALAALGLTLLSCLLWVVGKKD